MKESTFSVYAVTSSNKNENVLYVGMTTQTLRKRLSQHVSDATNGTCSVKNKKLCHKNKKPDLERLHTFIQKNGTTNLSIHTLQANLIDYASAKKSEDSFKRKFGVE